jgi:hypothetical protein
MVFLRLFIAIVLQTFQQTTERDSKFMSNDLSEHFRDCWSVYDPDATSFLSHKLYAQFLLDLGEPLGWDFSFNHNFIKQHEYLAEIVLPRHNTGKEYQYMDVFEHLVLIMIIRREVINFAIRTKHLELLGAAEGENKENGDGDEGKADEAREERRRNHFRTAKLEDSVKRKQNMNN